jgi:hypothetical protein
MTNKLQQLQEEIEKYQQLLESDLSEEEVNHILSNLDKLTVALEEELINGFDNKLGIQDEED